MAYLPENLVLPHLAGGRLKRVLEIWGPPFAGYHLYYPSRRQSSPAFNVLVDALRYRGLRRRRRRAIAAERGENVGLPQVLAGVGE